MLKNTQHTPIYLESSSAWALCVIRHAPHHSQGVVHKGRPK